jgi:hypothetical protein
MRVHDTRNFFTNLMGTRSRVPKPLQGAPSRDGLRRVRPAGAKPACAQVKYDRIFCEMRHLIGDEGDIFPDNLPYVDFPGKPLIPDKLRDQIILDRIKSVGNGQKIKPGDNLDLPQSEALYKTVRGYFDRTEPLMKTERWMADFVERNDLTYTDHDGKVYVMRGGIRVPAGHVDLETDDEEPDEEWITDEDLENI